jgi:hypothetical protein
MHQNLQKDSGQSDPVVDNKIRSVAEKSNQAVSYIHYYFYDQIHDFFLIGNGNTYSQESQSDLQIRSFSIGSASDFIGIQHFS